MAKKLEVVRGGAVKAKMTRIGDLYDSRGRLLSPDGVTICSIPNMNTDMSNKYVGQCGILKEGTYGMICREGEKWPKSLLLFDMKYWDEIDKWTDVTPEMTTLPSLIPNPTWSKEQNPYIMRWIQVHPGGEQTDGSKGCQTMPNEYWQKLISFFALNEKGLYVLSRHDGWKAPDFYQGN